MIKRAVNDKLILAYEICFQRDNVHPHIWSRDGEDEFAQSYCETELTDEEWNIYTKLAKGEYYRVNSALINVPVFFESMVGPLCDENTDIMSRVEKSLDSKEARIINDNPCDFTYDTYDD